MRFYFLILLVTIITMVIPSQVLCREGCEITDEECEMICRMNHEKLLPDNYEEDLFHCYQQIREIKCLEK